MKPLTKSGLMLIAGALAVGIPLLIERIPLFIGSFVIGFGLVLLGSAIFTYWRHKQEMEAE